AGMPSIASTGTVTAGASRIEVGLLKTESPVLPRPRVAGPGEPRLISASANGGDRGEPVLRLLALQQAQAVIVEGQPYCRPGASRKPCHCRDGARFESRRCRGLPSIAWLRCRRFQRIAEPEVRIHLPPAGSQVRTRPHGFGKEIHQDRW